MTRLRVTWRAAAAVRTGRVRVARERLLASHRRWVPLLLVIAGLGGGLGGGALVGEWCLGLVMIAESCLLVYVGMARDDGHGHPGAGHTVPEILERARHLP